MNLKNRVNVLGVDIDCVTKQRLYEKAEACLIEKSKTKIFTPNTEILIKAQKDAELKDILNSADISIADGVGLIIAAKILGTPLPERLAGIELGEYLLSLAAKEGFSIFLLGGKEGVAQQAKKEIEKKYKDINICGTHHGFFEADSDENSDVVSVINKTKPDILFVCMGFPRQEKWILKNMDSLPSVVLAIGLGGSLDVWSGNIRRAPHIFRAFSLEWLWRILLEPKRISFIANIPIFVFKILQQKHLYRKQLSKNNGKNAHLQDFFTKK